MRCLTVLVEIQPCPLAPGVYTPPLASIRSCRTRETGMADWIATERKACALLTAAASSKCLGTLSVLAGERHERQPTR
jgi:hypothetical protein